MNIAINNIKNVLSSDDPQVLTRLFNKLLEPNQDPAFLVNYTAAIRLELQKDRTGELGYSTFGQRCIDAGLVKAMLTLTTLSPYAIGAPKERYISQYRALEAVTDLMLSGDLTQRKALLDQMLKYDIVGICLRKLDHHLCIHRYQAVKTLQILSRDSFLGDKVSPSTMSDIMIAMCKLCLEGPKVYVDGLSSNSTAWQMEILLDKPGFQILPTKASKYGYRFYAVTQEAALWVAHGLLCTSPPPSRKACHEIIKKNPVLLDLLFDCAIIPRPESYPETHVDSIACQVISLLFQWPFHIVPGVSTNMDGTFKAQDWKFMSLSFKLLVDRDEWVEKIIEVWMKIEEEDYSKIQQLFDEAKKVYFAFGPQDENSLPQVFSARGTSRIAILRLLASLSHAVDSCGISNPAIESLLRIAYQGSHKIPVLGDSASQKDRYANIERTKEIFGCPRYTRNPSAADFPEHIAEESVLGPTALANLLGVLARRTGLETIQGPEVISRFLKIALQRIKTQADEGRTWVKEGSFHRARLAFTSAAELAAALVALDRNTKGQYAEAMKGVRKELVLALGNASEMALRTKEFHRALSFGLGAVSVAETIQPTEGLDPSIISKNKRRVEQARNTK
ncbi:hypothetical protein BJ138DRAFT_1151737 [Hygrophoropsis aurantiaca]|uniref:Uncharacterized protein n=1 Tax=Hygrophoropsis aurantiaca TaxID=72124 RepID=A0ACB8AD18_9AGAM|nr:hypothetical protein BJ138DRAFT_1151737 [Hygrophoropsis aurantiaca]